MVIPQKSICVIQQWLNMAEQIRIRHEAPSTGTARTFECLQLQLLYLFKKSLRALFLPFVLRIMNHALAALQARERSRIGTQVVMLTDRCHDNLQGNIQKWRLKDTE